MRFSFEESELINNFFEDVQDITKEKVIEELEQAKEHTEDLELIEIAVTTIKKIKSLDDETFKKVFADFPIDTYTEY